jgi:hypothetical protein
MKVDNFRIYLNELAKVIEASGGVTAAKPFRSLADGLDAFGGMDIKEFVEHIKKTDAHWKGDPPPTKPKREPKIKASRVNGAEIIAKVKELNEKATDLTISEETFVSGLVLLEKMSKADITKAAKGIDITVGKSWSIAKIAEEIRKTIIGRRDNQIRASFVDSNSSPA